MNPDFEKAAREYAAKHSSAPDKETPDWIINDFLAGCEHAYSIDKWISVKDQLPEYMQTVLIYDIIGFVTMAQYTGERDVFTVGDCYHQASHWQPLPEPPSTPDN